MTKDMKFDNGKMLAAIPFQDFPDAIEELVNVCTFGANKYERSSWKTVPNARGRYEDALGRHFLAQYREDLDPESKLYHKAHLAWNALATLQLEIEQQRKTDQIIDKTPKKLDSDVYSTGWISCNGVKPDINSTTEIEVYYRFGGTSRALVKNFRWHHDGSLYDILMYRILK